MPSDGLTDQSVSQFLFSSVRVESYVTAPAGTAGTKVVATTTGGSTAFSNGFEGVLMTVTDVNDAPVLSGAGMHLTTITEDTATNNGDLVSSISASAGGDPISDIDAGAVEGIAIFNLSNSNGRWDYDIGSGWTAVGSVSVNSV